MRRFAVLVIASVLAPALISAAVHTRPVVDFATLPGTIDLDFGNLPGEIELDDSIFVPHPMPQLEVENTNPCNSCFEYMTSLIDQLSGGNVDPVLPDLPTVSDPESEVPEVIRPLPLPVAPEVEIQPIPMPVPPSGSSELLPEDH